MRMKDAALATAFMAAALGVEMPYSPRPSRPVRVAELPRCGYPGCTNTAARGSYCSAACCKEHRNLDRIKRGY